MPQPAGSAFEGSLPILRCRGSMGGFRCRGLTEVLSAWWLTTTDAKSSPIAAK